MEGRGRAFIKNSDHVGVPTYLGMMALLMLDVGCEGAGRIKRVKRDLGLLLSGGSCKHIHGNTGTGSLPCSPADLPVFTREETQACSH